MDVINPSFSNQIFKPNLSPGFGIVSDEKCFISCIINEPDVVKQTLFKYSPNSPAALEIKKLAAYLSGRKYEKPKLVGTRNLIQRLADWLMR